MLGDRVRCNLTTYKPYDYKGRLGTIKQRYDLSAGNMMVPLGSDHVWVVIFDLLPGDEDWKKEERQRTLTYHEDFLDFVSRQQIFMDEAHEKPVICKCPIDILRSTGCICGYMTTG